MSNRITLLAISATAAVAAACFGGIEDRPNDFVLRSLKDITLGGDSTARGSVGADGSIRMGWGAKVTGKAESGERGSWVAPELPTWRWEDGRDVSLGWSQAARLDPGSYGTLKTDSSARIDLTAGDYNFRSMDLGWAGRVVADTREGDVYLYIAGGLTAGDATSFETIGDGTLYLVTDGPATFGYRSMIDAAIYSKDSLNFGNAASLTGFAFAEGSINAEYGSSFTYSGAVPGPAAAALLAMSAGVVAGSRRRRA